MSRSVPNRQFFTANIAFLHSLLVMKSNPSRLANKALPDKIDQLRKHSCQQAILLGDCLRIAW